jgi:MEMO1 family protein
MVRQPIVAGQFYEADVKDLEKQIKQSFLHEFGPRKLPEGSHNKRIIGAVCPHAGYFFSGAGAAFSFKEIGESPLPDTFIMLGLSHQGYRSCVSLDDWKTPLGLIKNDKEFGERLVKNPSLKVSESSHSQEHSIEVQLPFLQCICKKQKVKIVPIIVSPDISYFEIASAVKKTIDELKRKVCVIASSDFTHYGINYGYMPFSKNIKENMYALDAKAIDFIIKMDASGFLEYTEETGATICGKYPIAVLIELCKLLGVKKGKLLKYYTSGDILGDYSNAVGYASIVLE